MTSSPTTDRLRNLAPIIVAGLLALLVLGFVVAQLVGGPSEPEGEFVEAGGVVTGTSTAGPTLAPVATLAPVSTSSPSSSPTPAPTATLASPSATPTSTPAPAPTVAPPAPEAPPPAVFPDGFSAEVFACSSISGDQCDGEISEVTGGGSFTALVRFRNVNVGDQLAVTLAGPATFGGAPYTTAGSGDGYYYSEFSLSGLPAGEYALIATRNGTQAASTTLTLR